MTEVNRATAAAAERQAAVSALAEATVLEQMGYYGGAVSRSYYAAYHAARAAVPAPMTHISGFPDRGLSLPQ